MNNPTKLDEQRKNLAESKAAGYSFPVPDTDPQDVETEVCADIIRRQQLGIRKYGMTVAANPLPLREWLQHAYEENLDAAIYLKRSMREIGSPTTEHVIDPTEECARLRAALSRLNDAVKMRMSAEEPTGDERLELFRASISADEIL
jgi:hypothetical protein